MLFNTPQFAVFFVIVFCLYITLGHKAQNRMLLLASCLFYSAWNWKFLPIMAISISTDYFCSKYIAQSENVITRKRLLFLSIFINLAILGFFKYCNFFIDSFSTLLGYFHFPVSQSTLQIILPLGISFYTFEAISYVVDVYKKETTPARNFWDYALFIIYFPHLIAGPIMRAKSFLPQIELPRKIEWNNIREGCYLFFWGFFQKSFVADNLAHLVDPVFGSQGSIEGSKILLALYAFAFQIYCDFCGYSNMARGLAKCMGFEITNNFNLPYFSSNPQEFWRRWHISLSAWLRDYLYIPLGGSKKSIYYTCRNLAITMLLAGLWHGAAWTFVLWGAFHAVLLIGFHLRNHYGMKIDHSENAVISLIKTLFFFHVLCLGWLLFRAQSLTQVRQMMHDLFLNFHVSTELMQGVGYFLFYTWLLLLIEIFQKRKADLFVVLTWPKYLRWLVFIGMFYSLVTWTTPGKEEFIYFVF